MLSVSIKHPDSEAFIDAKMTEGKVTGANVSVKIDDEFMRCATEDKPYVQQFPIIGDHPDVRKEISAKALWEKIVHNAWKSAEPGVLFWDTILRESIPDLLCRPGIPHRVDKSLWRDSFVSLRLMPSAEHQSV